MASRQKIDRRHFTIIRQIEGKCKMTSDGKINFYGKIFG